MKLTKDYLISIGFKAIQKKTVMDSVIFDLGRNRHISVDLVGTISEKVFLCEVNHINPNEITDIICIHNYNYEGYLTEKKIMSLVNILSGKDFF